jgi:Fe-S cluster assembly protein SufD
MNETIQDKKLDLFTEKLGSTQLALPDVLVKKAESALSQLDFPTTRNEAWKYTRVGRIASIKAQINERSVHGLDPSFKISENAYTLVFENGQFLKDLSSESFPSTIIVKPLSACSFDELSLLGKNIELENEVFNSLNTAFLTDGMFIQIPDKTILEEPLQIIHILTGANTVSNTRHFIHCGKFAEAEIIMGFFSEKADSSFNNVISEIGVEENGKLSIQKIQYEGDGNFQVATEQVNQDKNSTFTINTLTLGGTFVRNNLNIAVNGENCETHLNGAYVLKDNQHVDNHTVVDHRAPHCASNELYKGVIDDKATAVFNGKVFVRKDSQKINAFQSNGNVLLSDNATVNSKPELEIYADDVKCSHGSTTGQLDEEAVFYLRARGISEKSARHLMVSAFIGDVFDKIENEDVLNFTHSIMRDRFGWDF